MIDQGRNPSPTRPPARMIADDESRARQAEHIRREGIPDAVQPQNTEGQEGPVENQFLPGRPTPGIRGTKEERNRIRDEIIKRYSQPQKTEGQEGAPGPAVEPGSATDWLNQNYDDKFQRIPRAVPVPEDQPKTSMVPTRSGPIRVLDVSRDQITGFKSTPGARMVSLDFNDASNKSARGIEIVLPRDATKAERKAAEHWAKMTQQFLGRHGVKAPLRRGNGIKIGGGKKGVIHTEPFFASNRKARDVISKNGAEYAQVLRRTLGTIEGVTFIPPHTKKGQGADSDGISEREFAQRYIIPELMQLTEEGKKLRKP